MDQHSASHGDLTPGVAPVGPPVGAWAEVAHLLAQEFGPARVSEVGPAGVPVVACRILVTPARAEFAGVGDVLSVSDTGMSVRVRGLESPVGDVEVEWLDTARVRGTRPFRVGNVREIAPKTWRLDLRAFERGSDQG